MSASLGEFAEHRSLEAQASLVPCFISFINALEVKKCLNFKRFFKKDEKWPKPKAAGKPRGGQGAR
jgi:hypothetical protein